MNNLILKRYTDGLSISLFVSPYHNNIDNNDINEMNNNDCLFSYILSSLVLSKKTKHIALPIINVDVKFSQMNDIIKPYEDIYRKYVGLKVLVLLIHVKVLLSLVVRCVQDVSHDQ
jgi:hypothetical protein